MYKFEYPLIKQYAKFSFLFDFFSFIFFSFCQKKYDKILMKIDSKKNFYSSIAQQIWSFAEMGYQEEKSSNLLKKILSDQEFNIKFRGSKHSYSFYG